jgi:hypothetical protein
MNFRIQERKASSNIIEQRIITEKKERWRPYLAPLIAKEEGDKLITALLITLNGV